MENTYGIGVTNRYNLFLDDEADPLEMLKVQEQEKELRKKIKVAEKENKEKVEPKPKGAIIAPRKGIKETQNVKPPEVKIKEEKVKLPGRPNLDQPDRPPRVGSDNRDERYNQRNKEFRQGVQGLSSSGYREDGRPPRREFIDRGEQVDHGNRTERVDRGDEVERRRGSAGPRTPGSGGRGRPVGTRVGYDVRGKREFDRQSGSDKTGIKPVDKREGGGAHNWGTHKDDIEDMNNKSASENEQPQETDKSDAAAPETVKVEGSAEPTDNAVLAEEELKELTLDEWKAQRAGRQKPQYNLRKAGEGEDPSQWKKMYALEKKKEGDVEESEEELEYDATDYPQRVGRQKHILDIEFHFNDARRSGGASTGRGRGSRAGRGAPVGRPRTERPPRPRSELSAPEREENPAVEGETHNPRSSRQNAPKVDDEHDFPSLG